MYSDDWDSVDTWDPKVLGQLRYLSVSSSCWKIVGGGISHYAGINHGTFLHIAHEEGLIRNTSIHAGIRAPVVRPKGDLRNDLRCGFEMIRARDIDRLGIRGVIDRLKERVEGTKVYISVDIDVLDPAFAPATGTSEVGGWSTRELLTILDGLEGLEIVGADVGTLHLDNAWVANDRTDTDIVEVAPIYDSAGEITVLAAAEVALSLIGLMVQQPVTVSA